MHQVQNLQLDAHFREIGCPAHHPYVVDIAARFADDLGDLGKRAGLVEGRDADAGGKTLGGVGVDVPGDVDPALVLELAQPRRVDLEDADALVGDQHPDDAV